MVALSWIPATLVTYGGMSRPLAWPLTGLLAAYLAAFHAALRLARRAALARGGRGCASVVLPALWVALEWLRT